MSYSGVLRSGIVTSTLMSGARQRSLHESISKVVRFQGDGGLPPGHKVEQRFVERRIERRRLVAGEQLLDLLVSTEIAVVRAVQLPLFGGIVVEQLGAVEGVAEMAHGMRCAQVVTAGLDFSH